MTGLSGSSGMDRVGGESEDVVIVAVGVVAMETDFMSVFCT